MQEKKDRKENKQSAKDASEEPDSITEVTSVWEWVAAFIGLVLVLGAIGFVLYHAIRGQKTPPVVKVDIDSVERAGEGYLLKFRAFNEGGSTAAGLLLEAELNLGPEEKETSQVTIDFLPAYSMRRGGFFFTRDPRQFAVQVRPLGYQEP